MTKNWNTDEVIRQVNTMYWNINDPRATGWETWPVKQDLYKIKWQVDEALAKCPKFAGEEEFLEEHEKELVWKALKK